MAKGYLRVGLWMGLYAPCATGFFCVDGRDGPSVPPTTVDSLRLAVYDTGEGQPGVRLDWTYPDGPTVDHFDLYRQADPDSPAAFAFRVPGSYRSYLLPLDLQETPATFRYGVRAVHRDPTGQAFAADSLPLAAITVQDALQLLAPVRGAVADSPYVTFQATCRSDHGASLRLWVFQALDGGWRATVDTCFPTHCLDRPLFGLTPLRDSLVLSSRAGDTVDSRWCLVATESDGGGTGWTQSIRCSRFTRPFPWP